MHASSSPHIADLKKCTAGSNNSESVSTSNSISNHQRMFDVASCDSNGSSHQMSPNIAALFKTNTNSSVSSDHEVEDIIQRATNLALAAEEQTQPMKQPQTPVKSQPPPPPTPQAQQQQQQQQQTQHSQPPPQTQVQQPPTPNNNNSSNLVPPQPVQPTSLVATTTASSDLLASERGASMANSLNSVSPVLSQAHSHSQIDQFIGVVDTFTPVLVEFSANINHSEFAAENSLNQLATSNGSTSSDLFKKLVEAALKSSLCIGFERKYATLKSLELHNDQFTVVAVLGQELLAHGHLQEAAALLGAACKIDTADKKRKGSVLSAISHVYCLMKDYENAINFMKEELKMENELKDVEGQCRVLSNLGYTCYKMRKFIDSLKYHREQVRLAVRYQLYHKAAMGLNAIGHVHEALQDLDSSLHSHSRALDYLKELCDNDFNQFKELLSIGHVYSMRGNSGDNEMAERTYLEAKKLLDRSGRLSPEELITGRIMVNFNLAYLALKKHLFDVAKRYYLKIDELANNLPATKQSLYKMRASNGLGQVSRLCKEFNGALVSFDRQLSLAEMLDDKVGLSQALCNLTVTYQQLEQYDQSRLFYERNMSVTKNDPILKAYSNSYLNSMS